MHISLEPRADQNDGLVALASIVSKTIRELWMDVFNDYWCERVPGLKRTAGYHTDAKRFRDSDRGRGRRGEVRPIALVAGQVTPSG